MDKGNDKNISDLESKSVGQNSNFEQTARLRIIKSEEIEANRKGKKIKKRLSLKPMKTSSIYKKKYLILAVTVILVFVIAYQFVKVKDLDFNVAGKKIEANIDMNDFNRGDISTLRKLYGINRLEVDDFVSFAPKTNMSANEILIIKCKQEYIDSTMKRIQNRVDTQMKSFKNYAPDQYQILSKSELKKKGEYIYFISYGNHEKINNAIKDSYK